MKMEKYACLQYDVKDLHLELKEIGTSRFDELLQKKWKDAMENGCFRYNLDHVQTKIIPGKYGFVAQLNVKRAIERRKPQAISSLTMAFDPNLFNFSKVRSEEVLFHMVPKHWNTPEFVRSTNEETLQLMGHVVIINVSPLEFCNSLLVPYVHRCLPQILTEDGLKLAVETMLLSLNTALRIGLNSLGANASVNHYHFHVYYLQQKLYLETATLKHLAEDCFEIVDFPAKGFAFQLLDMNVERLVKSVMKAVNFFISRSMAYNMFITRGSKFHQTSTKEITYNTVRVYLWVRKASLGVKNDVAFNVALCELAGHLPFKDEAEFNTATEEKIVSILQDFCQEPYLCVRDKIKQLYSGQEVE